MESFEEYWKKRLILIGKEYGRHHSDVLHNTRIMNLLKGEAKRAWKHIDHEISEELGKLLDKFKEVKEEEKWIKR